VSVRLVILDDSLHVRQMLVDILELHGSEVVGQASDGEEAWPGRPRRTPTWWSWT
jgi:DNA-binding NarL/FixJ family response regulator